ncbi:hypothetical protein G436_3741 [Leptospira interrogans serovar Hardjo str. Norma]|uniref:Uncharacterized protein n=1 Tax=Leptospira interrogans serovar Hardjo str. Norma TaxID=1279460 RepID=A0A0M4NYZ6_LEPIR|nr:hypothetical protein G436_3741 [Leptospira interrogans serovar Hardjo str. Norma]
MIDAQTIGYFIMQSLSRNFYKIDFTSYLLCENLKQTLKRLF